MTKLSDIHLVLLSSAAQRGEGSLLPPPETVTAPPARIEKAVRALLTAGYVTEAEVTDAARTVRTEDDRRIGVFITDLGRAALGVQEPETGDHSSDGPAVTAPPVKQTKAEIVLALLRRDQGATVEELTTATTWLPHTTRAALTGLRKKGHSIDKRKRDNKTCYHLETVA